MGGKPPIEFVERVRQLLDNSESPVPALTMDTGDNVPVSGIDLGDKGAKERRISSSSRRRISRVALAGAVIAVLVVLTVTFGGDVRQSVARLWNGPGTASTQRPFRSFAVLPVTFESSESQQRELASKLTDDLTALVGRTFPEGLVISSGLARHYSSDTRDPRKIGQELNVRYLIMGRLHPIEKGDELGVEFVDIEDGARLWTDRFTVIRGGELADALGRIGNELRHAADMAARKEVASLPEPKRTAWNLVLQSWGLDGSQPSIIKGQKLNEEALRLDPDLVPALYELAGALRARIGVVEPEKRKESIARLDEISVRAVAVAPNDPRAWILRSAALMWQGNANGAFAASDEALRLDPFRSDGLIERARLLGLTGRGNEALEILTRIIGLSPSEKISVLAQRCWISVTIGRDRDAIAPCETAAAANRYWLLYAYACAAHANVGDLDKAAYWKQKLIADYPNFSIKRFQDYRVSDDRVYLAQREHYYDGLRKAGIPEK
jgi:adenylate cyclase